MMMPPPTRESVMELEVRRRIVETIASNPGLHLRALSERLGVALSTLEYHCYQLARHGHLVTRQDGGYKCFYPPSGMDRRDRDILYLIRHEGPRRICAHLAMHPGTTPKELRDVTGLSGPTLSFHIAKLRKAEILDEEPAGRTKLLSLREPERVANLLVTYRKSFVDDAVDRFAKSWLELGAQAVREEHVRQAEDEA
jgi:predicted transcriptional regulator